MGFLGRLFAGGTPLERAEKAFARGEWAEAFSYAAECAEDRLAEADRQRLAEIVGLAGRRLAEMNIDQAEACLRGDERDRAAEHARLALDQTDDAELVERAGRLLAATRGEARPVTAPAPVVSDCSSCGSSPAERGGHRAEVHDESGGLDEEQGWELFLMSLPESWAERYRAHDNLFATAVLAAHGADLAAAATLFEKIPTEARDCLYRYEVACLKLRMGEDVAGLAALLAVLREEPGHELALQVAVDLARLGRSGEELLPIFKSGVGQSPISGLCHAGLAYLAVAGQDEESLLRHGLQALSEGAGDQDLVILLAGLFERKGDVDRAESLLKLLGRGGCSGGVHPLLGEFWLRQGRNLDRALESFKAAAREDKTDPRWQLRIAQAYLAKGWTKQAKGLLQVLARDESLTDNLRRQAIETLDGLGR